MKGSAEIRRTLTRKCAAMGIPVSGFFELTPRCNLQCKMCYIRMTPQQMAPIGRERTAREWLELGRDARDAGMIFLLLTGGEPTIREDFPEIYEGLARMGLSISINTDGRKTETHWNSDRSGSMTQYGLDGSSSTVYFRPDGKVTHGYDSNGNYYEETRDVYAGTMNGGKG